MNTQDPGQAEVAILRSRIETFIGERLKAKIDQLRDDESKREELQRDYGREIWLESASKRVGQIRLVTHALKYTHPDARGTSVYYPPNVSLPAPLAHIIREAV